MALGLPHDLQLVIIDVHDFSVELDRQGSRVEQPLSTRMLALRALAPIPQREEWQ